jgi:hypothetical protein
MTFFCLRLFFGIGPFQWVTPDSNKNFFPPQRPRTMLKRQPSLMSPPSAAQPVSSFRSIKRYITASIFPQANASGCETSRWRSRPRGIGRTLSSMPTSSRRSDLREPGISQIQIPDRSGPLSLPIEARPSLARGLGTRTGSGLHVDASQPKRRLTFRGVIGITAPTPLSP